MAKMVEVAQWRAAGEEPAGRGFDSRLRRHGCSFTWVEHWTVNPEVEGSTPSITCLFTQDLIANQIAILRVPEGGQTPAGRTASAERPPGSGVTALRAVRPAGPSACGAPPGTPVRTRIPHVVPWEAVPAGTPERSPQADGPAIARPAPERRFPFRSPRKFIGLEQFRSA